MQTKFRTVAFNLTHFRLQKQNESIKIYNIYLLRIQQDCISSTFFSFYRGVIFSIKMATERVISKSYVKLFDLDRLNSFTCITYNVLRVYLLYALPYVPLINMIYIKGKKEVLTSSTDFFFWGGGYHGYRASIFIFFKINIVISTVPKTIQMYNNQMITYSV